MTGTPFNVLELAKLVFVHHVVSGFDFPSEAKYIDEIVSKARRDTVQDK
eukprot:gene24028-30324_t